MEWAFIEASRVQWYGRDLAEEGFGYTFSRVFWVAWLYQKAKRHVIFTLDFHDPVQGGGNPIWPLVIPK